MDQSPKGRTIEYLVGNAPAIITRGHQIEKLGTSMVSSAATLKKIADGASGQKGLAVGKLKDVVGDCYKDLKLAGERYKPTGPALYHYGYALEELQPKIKSIVDDAETDWETYTQKNGAIPSAVPSGTEPSDDGSAAKKAAEEHKEAEAAATTAYNTWKGDAETFDGYYDTWEKAFDKAVGEIGEADDGGIEDSFWDDLDGFVAAALKVLNWVGLALAIACIIIGGPILAAALAVVSLVALGLTIYSFCRGNSSVTDLVLAAVAVVPFGKLSMLGKVAKSGSGVLGKTAKVAGFISRGGSEAGEFTTQVRAIRSAFKGAREAYGGGRGLLSTAKSIATYDGSGTNIISRLFTGKSTSDLVSLSTKSAGKQAADMLGGVWGDGFLKNIILNADAASGNRMRGGVPSYTLPHPLFGGP